MVAPGNHRHETLDKLVGTAGALHDWAYRLVEIPTPIVPAANFVRGLQYVRSHNSSGHTSFFMGEVSRHGHPAFFPVGILIKTPIPFLILMLGGAVILLRSAKRNGDPLAVLPPLAAALILLACIPSNINIGMRHVLPMFPLLAICAGVSAAALWQSRFANTIALRLVTRATLVILLTWQVYAGARAHPDYLAYFNECCSAAPHKWLINSDLDWGQDLARLSQELRARGVEQLYVAYAGTADIDQHDLPPHMPLEPYRQVRGWVAISELYLEVDTDTADPPPYDRYRWLLDHQPVTQVGKSIRLYWIP